MAAVPKNFKVDAAADTIPTDFDHANAASLVWQGARGVETLVIVNYSTSVLKVNYTHGRTSSSPTQIDAYVPAGISGGGPGWLVLDKAKLSPTLFIASDSGSTITSGVIRGHCNEAVQ